MSAADPSAAPMRPRRPSATDGGGWVMLHHRLVGLSVPVRTRMQMVSSGLGTVGGWAAACYLATMPEQFVLLRSPIEQALDLYNEYGDPWLGLRPGDMMTPRNRPKPPTMYVTIRGNVVMQHNHHPMVWHTWGLGTISDRKVMAEAFIAAAGRAPVIPVPTAKHAILPR